jgi:methylamine dehydrogenase accessory protein MauD
MSNSLVAILTLQWLTIIGLGAVVLALVRQVGILHQRIAPAGALMISEGVKIGATPPALALRTVDGNEFTVGGVQPKGVSTLVMFLAPDCPVCARLLPAVLAIAEQERDWLSIVFASDGANMDHLSFWRTKGLQNYPYVVSTELGLTFQIAKLPHGVLLDKTGTLVAQGLTNTREHVESLFEAHRLNVKSLQDYLARDVTPVNANS